MLDGCLNWYDEIDTDKALKKNSFIGICDWEDSIDLKDAPKIFISSDRESSKEDLKNKAGKTNLLF